MLIGNVQIAAGGPEQLPNVLALLEKNGINARRNPDVYIREYRQFGIDEARDLRERSKSRAFGEGRRRVFIAVASQVTSEAQNALLKTLEETPGNALYIFIVPSPHMLLTTVRSRAQMLDLGSVRLSTSGESDSPQPIDPRKFLAATPEKRLDMLSVLLEKDDDDPLKGLGVGKRDIGAIVAFLASLEALLSENVSAEAREGVRAVYRARAYIGDKGALLKPLLEQVALLSPKW